MYYSSTGYSRTSDHVITSATIDVDAFAKHFDDAPVVEIGGRGYPVEMRYVDRRIQLIGRALLLLVLSGLGIGVTVGSLFFNQITGIAHLGDVTATTFFIAIALLMVALIYLLLETRLVASTLRLPPEFLELERKDL